MNKTRLKFAKGNAKLGKETAIFSLPAGHTCPAALLCQSMANRLTGKITDGTQTVFRCYAAASENLFPNVRKSRWNNLEMLKACKGTAEMADLIIKSLPRKATLCRIHASGDFFSQDYFDAWLIAARAIPHVTFYAYTKMLPLWVRRAKSIPANFRLVASDGGKFDSLIAKHGLRHVKVVFSENEAKQLGLPIDHDDTHAWKENKGNFALLLHGQQPVGSFAAKQIYSLRKAGKGGYKADYFDHYKKPVTVK